MDEKEICKKFLKFILPEESKLDEKEYIYSAGHNHCLKLIKTAARCYFHDKNTTDLECINLFKDKDIDKNNLV